MQLDLAGHKLAFSNSTLCSPVFPFGKIEVYVAEALDRI